jgi:hypothetical protein
MNFKIIKKIKITLILFYEMCVDSKESQISQKITRIKLNLKEFKQRRVSIF